MTNKKTKDKQEPIKENKTPQSALNEEFKNIIKIKKDLPKESYIKYLEKVIKIQLKYISRLNKLK